MSAQDTICRHIVLVEDNPLDVFLLRRALEEYSVAHTLEVIPDGESALKYLAQLHARNDRTPDLMVLD